MATTTTRYNTQITINNTVVGYASEVDLTIDFNLSDQDTFDGKILSSLSQPGCEVEITKYTKHDAVSEKAFMAAVMSLKDVPGTITITNIKPKGTMTWVIYECRIDELEITDEAGELLEFSLTVQGEDFDCDWE